jgi:hypothetical protein
MLCFFIFNSLFSVVFASSRIDNCIFDVFQSQFPFFVERDTAEYYHFLICTAWVRVVIERKSVLDIATWVALPRFRDVRARLEKFYSPMVVGVGQRTKCLTIIRRRYAFVGVALDLERLRVRLLTRVYLVGQITRSRYHTSSTWWWAWNKQSCASLNYALTSSQYSLLPFSSIIIIYTFSKLFLYVSGCIVFSSHVVFAL